MANRGTSHSTHYIHLLAGYGISFIAIGISYLLYSRLLSPEKFGLYSIALAIGLAGIFILDGGLKTALIKERHSFTKTQLGSVISWLMALSFLLILLLAAAYRPITFFFPTLGPDYGFLALFTAIYLLSYPFILVPTAQLERKLEYSRLAWIESISTVIERAGAVPLLLWTSLDIYSFALALAVGRLFRATAVNIMLPVAPQRPTRSQLNSMLPLIKEGLSIQAANGTALIRDNLHILIIGPLFGKIWVGYYAWGLQLCMVLSQAFVQISSRVSLPLMAQADSNERWEICIRQIRFLTMFSAPVMAVSLLLLPGVNDQFFDGKWAPIITLLPVLYIRMLLGIAITPIATLVQIQSGGFVFMRSNLIWTFVEGLSALATCIVCGPSGLAFSYAIVAIIGLGIYTAALGSIQTRKINSILNAVISRPSLWLALALATIAIAFKVNIPIAISPQGLATFCAATALITFSYLLEKDIRKECIKYINKLSKY